MLVSSAFAIGVALAFSECSTVCSKMASELHSTCPRPDPRFKTMFHNVKEDVNMPSDWIPDQGCDRCPVRDASAPFRSLRLPQARQTKFQFRNTSPEIVQVYWHDKSGRAHFKKTLKPGGTYGVGTWEGHAFRVWNKDQTVILLDYTVGRLPLSNPTPKSKKCRLNIKEKLSSGRRRAEAGRPRSWKQPEEFEIIPSTYTWANGMRPSKGGKTGITQVYGTKQEDYPEVDWKRARFVGFVNRASVDVDFYYVKKGEEEIRIRKMPPAGVDYQITYHSHEFRAKVSDSSMTVSEVKVDDIEIPDCGQRRRCNCGGTPEINPLVIKSQDGVNVNDTEPMDTWSIPSITSLRFDYSYSR